jgi:hypothetical protein
MDKQKFIQQLDHSLQLLVNLTEQYCYNTIAPHFKFIIEPSGSEPHEGMDDFEIRHLLTLNRSAGKLLSKDEMVTLLCHNNKVPHWINMCIYESGPDITVVHLLCSRTLRYEDELYHQSVPYPPFNVGVPIPYNVGEGKSEKFDINWKRDFDNKRQPVSLLSKVKNWFTINGK